RSYGAIERKRYGARRHVDTNAARPGLSHRHADDWACRTIRCARVAHTSAAARRAEPVAAARSTRARAGADRPRHAGGRDHGDGERWSAQAARSAPVEAGPGAMLYDARLGRVVYVSGVGRAWSWTGSGWQPLALKGAPSVAPRESAAVASTFAAGYDGTRDLL